MIIPSFDSISKYSGSYNMVPICQEIYADVITPITLLRRLSTISRNFYLLESIEGGSQWGRYSFLGFNPLLHITCKNHCVTIKSGGIETTEKGDAMDILRKLHSKYKSPHIEGMPPFTGGFVGYFSYEMIGYAEPKLNLKESEFNDYDLMLFDKVIAYDHLKQKINIVVNMNPKDGIQGYNAAVLEIKKIIQMIHDTTPLPKEHAAENADFKCNISKEEYCNMVEKTIHYIHEGDIFQGVISRRFEADYKDSLMNAYRVLRTTNPSPYMYFIQSDDVQIAGSSPETMIKLNKGKLTTFPVAGTRPRGNTTEEDKELEAGLLKDEKELAEHNMLVDLARNDVGRIAEYGSVYVEDYMSIHRFSKVMHIASVVCGQIRNDKDGCDTISALLPAGTLSGAPKFRACEIINELEPTARGVYGGAIGYLDFSGNLDVCIAIRTAVKKGDKVYVQAGAGVVADSVPENEYQECANKAGAVIDAIKRASEVNDL
ncbi:MAG: anthranilate synthase component I [Lachnospiraceae bacterium]|nr:anthranilate synthase component I [Lachnospiraceae bacterium]